MLKLIRADLRGLVNLVRQPEGRRVLISAAISIGFLALVSTMFGGVLAASPEFADLYRGRRPEDLRALLSTLTMPGVLLTAWFGLGGGRRILFELPRLELLLASPVTVATLLTSNLLRFGLLTAAWGTALCGPMMRAACSPFGVELGWGSIALAMFTVAMPILSFLFVIQIAIVRWCAGRVSQLVLSTLSVVASSVFSLLLLLGALAQEDSVRQAVGMARGRSYPAVVDNAARLLSESATGGISLAALATALAAPLAAALLLLAVAPFYRRAYANSKQAIEPLFRSRGGRGWSGSAARTTFRKELAQILHQPSQLIGLLFSAIVIVVMAGSRFLTDHVLGAGELPEPVRHCFLIVGLWLFAQLTIAPSCLFRLTVADGPQWPLYVGAPVARTTLLRGKLMLIALLQLWPAPVALVVGRVLYGADALALLLAAAILPAALLWTTSLTAVIGTLPMLMRPDPERSNILALLAVLIMLIALQLSVIPGIQVWLMLTDYYAGLGPLAALSPGQLTAVFVGGIWTVSFALSAVALALGARNFARLARPATR